MGEVAVGEEETVATGREYTWSLLEGEGGQPMKRKKREWSVEERESWLGEKFPWLWLGGKRICQKEGKKK